MTAEHLCDTLRADGTLRRVSIVVVGKGGFEERGRLNSCRANHWFTRPLDHGTFEATVRQLVSIAARQQYGVLVSVEVEGRAEGVPFFAKTENLSISGILITTSRPLKVGETVELAFFLPAFGRVVLEAEVVRAQPRDGKDVAYGARFLRVSPRERDAIGAFVDSRMRRRPEGPRG